VARLRQVIEASPVIELFTSQKAMAEAIKISGLARQEGGRGILIIIACVATASLAKAADLPRQPYTAGTYASRVFGEERHYRIFLTAEYNTTTENTS